MKKLFKEIIGAGLLVSLLIGLTGASIAGATTTLKVAETPAVSVYTSQGQTDTTLVVTPVPVDLDGNVLTMSNFGSGPTVTVDPGVSGFEEIESFTNITNNGNNTATLSGITRDLQSVYPYTGTGTGKQHGGGAVVVFSNNPQLYGRLAAPENDNVWTGLQTYSTANQPVYNGNPSFSNPFALIDKAYADALSIVGAPTSTESGMGVVRLATFGQVGTGIASSTSGAPYVIENKFASSTYNGSTAFQGEIPALRSTKDIDPNFIATSSANTYNFGATIGLNGPTSVGAGGLNGLTSASTTLNGTTTANGITSINTLGATYTSATTTTSWPKAMVIATSTGKVTTGSSLLASSTIYFIGFSQGNLTAGNPTFVQTQGVVSGFTGLTTGLDYYLQDSGAIGTSVGTLEAYVGTAVSSTQLELLPPRQLQYSGSISTGTAVPPWVRELVFSVSGSVSGFGYAADLVVKNVGITSATSQQVDFGGGSASYGISCSFTGSACSSSGSGTLTGVGGTAYMYR